MESKAMTVAPNPHHAPYTSRPELMVHAYTYHRFMLGVKWFAIHAAALIVLLTLWFCTTAGFGWGLIAGLIVYGVGVYAMNHGLSHTSEGETVDNA
jgi:hypothetical protein